MMRDLITYMGQPAFVACDGLCTKAWGWNSRPRHHLDDSDPDAFAWLADDELGEAPADPGTYEGADAKPSSVEQFPNRWCVRQCERCVMQGDGPLTLRDWSKRIYNNTTERTPA